MGSKKCIRCDNTKDILDFYYRKDTKKYKNECKECCKRRQKIYVESNYNVVIKKNIEYQQKHQEKIRKIKRKSKIKNRESRNIREKERKINDPGYRVMCNIRSRVSTIVSRGYKSSSATLELGCSINELRLYIESKFQPNMTWENYGEWHIDHIRPLSSFNLSDINQFKQACVYTNLQPLWAKDNWAKGSKISKEFGNDY